MKSVQLIFGTYNLQPVGSSTETLEAVYQNAYKPFLSLLNEYPSIRLALYYSGAILYWLEKRHPELIMLLGEMVKRGQVEFLTGGFYDPILPLIPNADRLGQIEKLTTYLRAHFGKRPRGCWLPELVWEPNLASTLNSSGVEYIFLDESHFRFAGLDGEMLLHTYLTEDQGKTVSVLPLSGSLGLQVLSSSPEEIVSSIERCAGGDPGRLVCLMLDGNVLGTPTNELNRRFGDGWFDRLFQLLVERKDVIDPVLPGQHIKAFSPKGKVYFPSSSSLETMQWCAAPEKALSYKRMISEFDKKPEIKPFLRGGFFRQFLTRYPESNLMYARMIYTHIQVRQIRGDKIRRKTAQEELWKGQCHNAYWHGRDSGIYSSHLRKEVYRNFMEAEKVTRSNNMFTPSITSFDFDMDGRNEFLFQGDKINSYVHSKGGVLFELDYLPVGWNYSDTLARRPEAYHTKEEKLYDSYLRKSFMDHFYPAKTSIDDIDTMQYREAGDFVDQPYELVRIERDHLKLCLTRNGSVRINRNSYPVRVSKDYTFKPDSIQVNYSVSNLSNRELSLWFGTELNFAFSSNRSDALEAFVQGTSLPMDRRTCFSGEGTGLVLEDLRNRVAIDLVSEKAFSLWSLPVETISQTRRGRVKNYQSSCFIPQWKFTLGSGDEWSNATTLSFRRRRKRKSKS